ncbi:hypothetical protein IN07_18295 [Modestobacter caceresii]|uniref:Uncharacterized protein n=1 Tax=Modestobacter caceresii TaxID=1522368 RepID=A0A098Y438_9ACTN|nr:hypothetical protein IN07_18295 [Modestobacter caceresii]
MPARPRGPVEQLTPAGYVGPQLAADLDDGDAVVAVHDRVLAPTGQFSHVLVDLTSWLHPRIATIPLGARGHGVALVARESA